MSAPRQRRSLSIRARLMLFLCSISLLVPALLWFLSTRMLEPLYNRRMNELVSHQADQLAAMIEQTLADGRVISSRDFGILFIDGGFRQEVYETFGPAVEQYGLCLDISDSTTRGVLALENLYPCLLHKSKLMPDGEKGRTESNTAAVLELRAACRAEGRLHRVLKTSHGSDQLVVGRTAADGAYTVLVATSLEHVAQAGEVLGELMPWLAALVFLLSAAAAWCFSAWFTRPLRELSAAARRVAAGDYSVTVESRSGGELGLLAREFNHMTAEVRRSAQLQRELLANVSHDLRTPLTLIKGYAETVRDISGEDKTRREEQMNIIIDETDRLSGLVSSVMELSKVSSGAEKCEPVEFDMGQLCEEVSERYEAVCAQNGLTLRLELPDAPLPVCADPAMMERVLHNLLGNAMHHIGPDGVFILRAAPCAEGCRVEIEDHGAGIAAADLPYIFDRYYRSRADAGRPGTGLGLSITKAILQQHGFRFGVDSTVGRGTVFWFIPKAPQ